MADDERRAEIEAVWEYLIAHTGEPGIIDGQWREGPAAQVIGLIAHALDRVRDARGGDEAAREPSYEAAMAEWQRNAEGWERCRAELAADGTVAVEDALAAVDWYRRCLEDVQDGRPVHGLLEAKLGYDKAMDALLAEFARPDTGEQTDHTTAEGELEGELRDDLPGEQTDHGGNQ